jgi:hypothetical protein
MASIISAGTTSGTSLNLSADTSGVLQLATNGTTTAVTIDTSQNVGIGTTSPSSFAGKLVVNGGVSLLNSNRLYLWSPSNGFAPAIYAPSESIAFTDNNGVETFRVGSTGVLTLKGGNNAASGVGITFPTTQSASSDANTLDDYEEGTWTPQLKFGGNSVSMTYSIQSGSYTKIGRLVYATCRITLSNKGTSTGSASITGLPFTSGSGNANYSAGAFGYVEAVGNGSRWSVLQLPVQDAGTTLIMLRYYTGLATSDHNEASFNNNTDFIIFTSYQV